jgi:immunity protein 35 of polymorphic toxin system
LTILIPITFEQARQIAEQQIKAWSHGDIELIILEPDIIEKWYGWIFPSTSKKFYETGDMRYAVVGNCPLFISKLNGEIAMYSTGYSLESMIEIHEEEFKLWQLHLDHDIYDNTQLLTSLKKCMNFTMADVVKLKSSHLLLIDGGSHNRLLAVQEKLAELNIKATIRKAIEKSLFM